MARSRLHDQAKITSDQPLAVQIAQKHPEHSAPNPQRGAAKAFTPLGQKPAHHGRRELVQILTPQIGQISSECAEVLVVQAQGGITKSSLLAEVGRKPRSPIREWLADRLTTRPTDESRKRNAQHLLDRNPCVTSHRQRRPRGPTWMRLVDPVVQEWLQMGRELLVPLRSVALRERAELT